MRTLRNKRIAGVVLWVMAIGVLLPIILLNNGRLESMWIFMLCMGLLGMLLTGYVLVDTPARSRRGLDPAK